MKKIPVIALRDVVVFPESTVYLEIGRKQTINAINRAMHGDKMLFAVTQRKVETGLPEQKDLYTVGTLVEVRQIINTPDKMARAVIVGKKRMELTTFWEEEESFYADLSEREESGDASYTLEVIAMVRELKELFRMYADLLGKISERLLEEAMAQTDFVILIDQICADIPVHYQLKQQILEEENIFNRYEALNILLRREIAILQLQEELARRVKEQVDENQKEYYLREQIKAIHKELGEEDAVSEADRFRKQLEKLKAPKKVKKKIAGELARFRKISSTSSESAVIREYITTLLKFPWKKASKERLDVTVAEEILDADHYGLVKVKERILECLSVKALKPDAASPIICLVGPPGTGKTSIAKSVARAQNRKYVRICLGGVRDEAEIRGHRRTYVGAMPGRIVAGMINGGVNNPVMLLDEVDKLGSDYKGDPSSALLEVLDPEQNKHFSDHYMDLPVDLSKVMFLCTANTLETIPTPLKDRMEIIELSGYTENEKFHIAKEHLWEKQKSANGLTKNQITITDRAIRTTIVRYTREAGVRGLEKKLATLCRKAAFEIAGGRAERVRISERNIKSYLGKELHRVQMANKKPQVGIVRGLAWTSAGGDTLEIEVTISKGAGALELTGKLGEVMQESAKIALTYVKSQTMDCLEEKFFSEHDIHIHVPEGAVPKDGPSAGVTLATALYSAVTKKKTRSDVAMTGELSLRGRVLPIGGLKEKLLAAKVAGIRQVFIPDENRKDLEEMDEEILEGLTVTTVTQVQEIWKEVFV
ncbi:MAG: endopeptidase La [Lachnospiraceae bacterium]|nr:endopeptidase La [Lachnospiraceae bacterium]